MKKLITLLAVFGFATTAFADDHMKQNGSFRVVYDNNTNTGDFDDNAGDKNQDIFQRFIWSPTFKVSDAVSVHTTLVHSSAWGNNPDQVPAGNTAHSDNDSLIVNEAYANWMINDESMLRIGRGSFTMADGRVVAQNEWEQVRKAFDGLMYTHDHEMVRASAFAVRGATDTTQSNTSGNFYGLNFDLKSLPEFLKTANLHYVIIKRDAATYPNVTAVPDEDTTRIGLTVGGDTAGVDYNLTYAMYSGDGGATGTDDVDASMYDVTVGYSLPDMMNLRISAQMHSDSGDEGTANKSETYTGFHYDTHNNAGLMDIIGYGNLTFTRVGVTLDAQEGTTVGVDYYMFSATEDTDGWYKVNNPTAVALVGGDDDLGTEIDVWVQHNYSSNFSTKFRYGTFDSGDGIAGDDAAVQYYLEGMMTF